MRASSFLLLALALCLTSACSDPLPAPMDAPPAADAGDVGATRDGGLHDDGGSLDGALARDASSLDATDVLDASELLDATELLDAGAPDAPSTLDAAALDAAVAMDAPLALDAPSPLDAGADAPAALDAATPVDALVTLDAGSPDAGSPDAGSPDAGSRDAGRTFSPCAPGMGYDPTSPWPTWGRCSGRTSHAGLTGPASVGSVSTVTVATTSSLYTVLNGLDGVAIAGSGAIYVNGTLMRAYDAAGSPLWFVSGASSPTQASVGADGTVYFAAGSTLYAMRPDGTERWRFALTEPGPTGAPAIGEDGTIYVSTEFALYGVTSTGAMRFRASYGNAYNGPPALGPDGSVYVAGRVALHAYRADGVGRWDVSVPLGNAITSGLHVGASGDVYYGHGSATTFRVSAVSGATGVERWRLTIPSPARTLAIGPDGTVYAVADNLLVAISPTGVEERRIGGTSFGQPLIDAAGTIYVTDAGSLRALRPDGSSLWTRRVDVSSHGPAMAADGTIVLSGGAALVSVHP